MAGSSRSRPMPWALIMGGLLIAVLLAGVIYFPVRIVSDAEARKREHHGTVTISYCRYSGRANDTAHCAGTFRSDDGALYVEDVSATFLGAHQDMRKHETATATLAGPHDATADLDENVGTSKAVIWTLDAALFAWLIAQVVWFGREIRRRRASGPQDRPAAKKPAPC